LEVNPNSAAEAHKMDSAGALIDLIAFFTQALKRIHVARHGAPAVFGTSLAQKLLRHAGAG
jgi:hypothetical protein